MLHFLMVLLAVGLASIIISLESIVYVYKAELNNLKIQSYLHAWFNRLSARLNDVVVN